MNTIKGSLTVGMIAIALGMSSSARANVYATNIKFNHNTNNVTIGLGGTVDINYILNEPASAGVAIKILSGTNIVRAISLPGGSPGTLPGSNTVTWDGKNSSSNNLSGGAYSVSITASSIGYSNWTQITSDTNAGNIVFQCRGLDVNKNTNSFFYGRIFVANSTAGANTANPAGDQAGLQKLNADASPAEEGVFADGGYAWPGTGYGPWKIKVGHDDRVYVEDWSGQGNIFAWDQLLTPATLLNVMRDDNNPFPEPAPPTGPVNYAGLTSSRQPQGNLSGFAITGDATGTNNQVWMADDNTGGWGIMHWNAQIDGTLATNLAPDIAVRATAAHFSIFGSDLDDSALDLDIDKNGNLFVAQQPWNNDQFKIFRFSPYTNTTLTNAVWKAGDTLTNDANDVTAIAVNPAGTYVAVSLGTDAKVLLLDSATGTNIATISDDGHPEHAVAWDNVGNLYHAFDDPNGFDGGWRCWSPPGTNQATTAALESIIVNAPVLPLITSIVASANNVTITFTGSISDTPSTFKLQSSSALKTGYADELAVPTQISPGLFHVTTARNGSTRFYRIKH